MLTLAADDAGETTDPCASVAVDAVLGLAGALKVACGGSGDAEMNEAAELEGSADACKD